MAAIDSFFRLSLNFIFLSSPVAECQFSGFVCRVVRQGALLLSSLVWFFEGLLSGNNFRVEFEVHGVSFCFKALLFPGAS